MASKNLTLSIDEDLLDRARVLAAMRRTSVNAMIRDYLDREVRSETQDAARAEAWSRLFHETDRAAGERQPTDAADLDRQALYEEVMRERGLL